MARGQTSFIGNAGEYFVLAELLRRGIVAALAPRNMPDYDIIAVDGPRSLKIRVKTKSAGANSFRWNVRSDGTMFGAATHNDLVVLVDLGRLESTPKFYALKTSDLEGKMKNWMDEWLANPRGGRKRADTGMRFLFPVPAHLEQHEGQNAWALIEQMLGRSSQQIGEEVTQP